MFISEGDSPLSLEEEEEGYRPSVNECQKMCEHNERCDTCHPGAGGGGGGRFLQCRHSKRRGGLQARPHYPGVEDEFRGATFWRERSTGLYKSCVRSMVSFLQNIAFST